MVASVDLDFKCDAENFGFSKNLIAEIEVEVYAKCNSPVGEDDCDYELEVLDFDVIFFGVKHKYLQSFSSSKDIDDIWDYLKEEQKDLINSWINQKLKEKEVFDKISELYADKSVAYYEGTYDR